MDLRVIEEANLRNAEISREYPRPGPYSSPARTCMLARVAGDSLGLLGTSHYQTITHNPQVVRRGIITV